MLQEKAARQAALGKTLLEDGGGWWQSRTTEFLRLGKKKASKTVNPEGDRWTKKRGGGLERRKELMVAVQKGPQGGKKYKSGSVILQSNGGWSKWMDNKIRIWRGKKRDSPNRKR